MPSGRVLKPAGAPKVSFPATDFRSPIEDRLYFDAVAAVTVIVSESWAAADLRTVSLAPSAFGSAASTSAVALAVALGSTKSRVGPLYSGTKSIEPDFSAVR